MPFFVRKNLTLVISNTFLIQATNQDLVLVIWFPLSCIRGLPLDCFSFGGLVDDGRPSCVSASWVLVVVCFLCWYICFILIFYFRCCIQYVPNRYSSMNIRCSSSRFSIHIDCYMFVFSELMINFKYIV